MANDADADADADDDDDDDVHDHDNNDDDDYDCSDIRSQKQADINSNTTGLIEQAIQHYMVDHEV